jgi:hypothetical protein
MPHQRKGSKSSVVATRQSKRIVIPVSREEYAIMVEDTSAFRSYLDGQMAQHPELFPSGMEAGYRWYGWYPVSKKMPEVRMRRIRLKASEGNARGQVFSIAPSFVMPYAMGDAQTIEKALFLRRFGVPYWGLSYVFGRNDMYWQRLENQLGRYDVVGTTVRVAEKLPKDVLADEKHVKLNGDKAYVATTVGGDCVLGVALALKADTPALTAAYAQFRAEAQRLAPTYQPQTVNTDGWDATQQAWRTLFPRIVILECFLHAFLKIRDRCKRLKAVYTHLERQVWDAYHAVEVEAFHQQLLDLAQWASQHLTGTALESVQKLCAKAPRFALAFDYPQAHRTSNMIDRHMEPLARCLSQARAFHGHLISAQFQLRAWALLHNFQPYCPRAQISQHYLSPMHQLNGFVYHDNWLQNLLISTSVQYVLYIPQNPLE